MKQEQHTTQLDTLVSLATNSGVAVPETDDVTEGPYSSLDDFLKFDSSLTSSTTRGKIKRFWSSFGGATVHDTATRILRLLCTDNVVANFSYQGAKGKLKFCELESWAVLRDAVRSNKRLKETTDFDIEMVVKSWLRHAKERDHKRTREEPSWSCQQCN
ncbi:uncharacterized protein LOC135395611 [Ornithodoros turicata]|uniref:uncharacterized protein LOC135395611 n=1 Tax=Ornithodoros turicata TaxID=34597 RepID=UPI003139ABA0